MPKFSAYMRGEKGVKGDVGQASLLDGIVSSTNELPLLNQQKNYVYYVTLNDGIHLYVSEHGKNWQDLGVVTAGFSTNQFTSSSVLPWTVEGTQPTITIKPHPGEQTIGLKSFDFHFGIPEGQPAGFSTNQYTSVSSLDWYETPIVQITPNENTPNYEKSFTFDFGIPQGRPAGFSTEMGVSVSTLPSTSNATVSVIPDITTPNYAKKFNFEFGIPNGVPGGFGEISTSTLQINSDLPPQVLISSSGPESAKNFDFVFKIPKGEKGEMGNNLGTYLQIDFLSTDLDTTNKIYWEDNTLHIKRDDDAKIPVYILNNENNNIAATFEINRNEIVHEADSKFDGSLFLIAKSNIPRFEVHSCTTISGSTDPYVEAYYPNEGDPTTIYLDFYLAGGHSNGENGGTISNDDLNSLLEALDNKSDLGHIHDDRYYTENEINTILSTIASLDSPVFIGIPEAPTASEGTSTSQLATTAFVQKAVNDKVEEAPINNTEYVRKNGDWFPIEDANRPTYWGEVQGTISNQTDLWTALNYRTGIWNIANTFSENVNYSVGAYTINNGTLYRFTLAHPQGEWSEYDNLAVTVMDELSLKANLASLGTLAYKNDAPMDNASYVRKNGAWSILSNNSSSNNENVSTTTYWGQIYGTLSEQTDLQNILNTKPNYNELGTLAYTNDAPLDGYEYVRKNGMWKVSSGGSGSGGGTTVWGDIIGNLTNQTDLLSILNAKQNILEFDDFPTNGSNNPVKSGGLYNILSYKADTSLLGSLAYKNDAPSNGEEYVRKNGTWVTLPEGRQNITPRGEWDSTYTYSPNDIVNYNGSTYIAITSVPENKNPANSLNSSYWQPFRISTQNEIITWGQISGTLSDQTDLQNILNTKVNITNLGTLAYINDAPSNGYEYVRKNGSWTISSGGGSGGNGSESGNITGPISWYDIIDKPSTFSPSSHIHDDRYYTESEINSLLSYKVDTSLLGTLAYKNDAPSNGNNYVRKDGQWVISSSSGIIELSDLAEIYDSTKIYQDGDIVIKDGKLCRVTSQQTLSGFDEINPMPVTLKGHGDTETYLIYNETLYKFNREVSWNYNSGSEDSIISDFLQNDYISEIQTTEYDPEETYSIGDIVTNNDKYYKQVGTTYNYVEINIAELIDEKVSITDLGTMSIVDDVPNDDIEYVRKNKNWVTPSHSGEKVNPCGDWNSTSTYSVNDIVSCDGNTYIAITSVPSSINPADSNNTNYWQLFAASGQGITASWGQISGKIANQTDLQDILNEKISNLDLGDMAYQEDVPNDNNEYVRKNGEWTIIENNNSNNSAVWGQITGTLIDQTDLIETIMTQVRGDDIAPVFNTSTTYAVGDIVFYQAALWKFKQPHPAGAWNVTHVESIRLALDIKTKLENKANSSDLGSLAYINDAPSDGNEYIRKNGDWSIVSNSGNSNNNNNSNDNIGSIYYAECLTSASNYQKTIQIPNFTLTTGVSIIVNFKYGSDSNSISLNINNTGYRQVSCIGSNDLDYYRVKSLPYGAILLLTYNGTSWILNTSYTENQTYLNSLGDCSFSSDVTVYNRELLFHVNDNAVTPLNSYQTYTQYSSTFTTTKTLLDVEFDPFGQIYYYDANEDHGTNTVTGKYCYYTTNKVDLRYTFNIENTFLSNELVYLKVRLQPNGKCKIDVFNPIVQSLPNMADGYHYILLGKTKTWNTMVLFPSHPIYYNDGTSIKQYLNYSDSSIHPCGDWDSNSIYFANDIVTYEGNTYIAITSVPENIDPSDSNNTNYWQLFATSSQGITAAWGQISGNIQNQTDLYSILSEKIDLASIAEEYDPSKDHIYSTNDLVLYKGKICRISWSAALTKLIVTEISTEILAHHGDYFTYNGNLYVYYNNQVDEIQYNGATAEDVFQAISGNLTELQVRQYDPTEYYTYYYDQGDYVLKDNEYYQYGKINPIEATLSYILKRKVDITNLGTLAHSNDAPIDGHEYTRKDGGWYPTSIGTWGNITGTLSDQTDLYNILNPKANQEDIAYSFDTNQSYSKGDCVIYSGSLWYFTRNKPSGSWDESYVSHYPISDIIDRKISGKANSADLGTLSTIDDAPSDNNEYVRKNGRWSIATGGNNGQNSGGGNASWGDISGILNDQTDLQTELDKKTEKEIVGNSWSDTEFYSNCDLVIKDNQLNKLSEKELPLYFIKLDVKEFGELGASRQFKHTGELFYYNEKLYKSLTGWTDISPQYAIENNLIQEIPVISYSPIYSYSNGDIVYYNDNYYIYTIYNLKSIPFSYIKTSSVNWGAEPSTVFKAGDYVRDVQPFHEEYYYEILEDMDLDELIQDNIIVADSTIISQLIDKNYLQAHSISFYNSQDNYTNNELVLLNEKIYRITDFNPEDEWNFTKTTIIDELEKKANVNIVTEEYIKGKTYPINDLVISDEKLCKINNRLLPISSLAGNEIELTENVLSSSTIPAYSESPWRFALYFIYDDELYRCGLQANEIPFSDLPNNPTTEEERLEALLRYYIAQKINVKPYREDQEYNRGDYILYNNKYYLYEREVEEVEYHLKETNIKELLNEKVDKSSLNNSVNNILDNLSFSRKTYYISAQGSDEDGDGSSSSPFATIQHAIDVAPFFGYTQIIIRDRNSFSENYITISQKFIILDFSDSGVLTSNISLEFGGKLIFGYRIRLNGDMRLNNDSYFRQGEHPCYITGRIIVSDSRFSVPDILYLENPDSSQYSAAISASGASQVSIGIASLSTNLGIGADFGSAIYIGTLQGTIVTPTRTRYGGYIHIETDNSQQPEGS